MPLGTRPGLSFEVAPQPPAHPNRTDVACFVGTVARRRDARDERPLPAPLRLWLDEASARSRAPALPDRQRVRLDDPEHTLADIADAWVARGWPDSASPVEFRRELQAALNALPAVQRTPAQALPPAVVEIVSRRASLTFAALADSFVFDLSSVERLLASLARRLLDPGTERAQFAFLVQACRELSPLPGMVVEALRARSYAPGGLLGPGVAAACTRIQALFDVPVPIESFEQFDALFDWESRPVLAGAPQPGDPVVTTSLGVAVRAFFGEGGARCYVVRTGEPGALFDEPAARFGAVFPAVAGPAVPQLRGVVPRFALGLLASVVLARDPVSTDGTRWQGLDHVFGLTDVSFACLPDLIDGCAEAIPAMVPEEEVLATPERFRECAPDPLRTPEPVGRRLPPPRLNSLGLEVWRGLVEHASDLLDNWGRAFHRRDVQLVASLPLTGEGRDLPTPNGWLAWMAGQGGWIAGERIQLGYPWLVTRDSDAAQGRVEAPEGCLLGVLARNALERGAYRTAALQPLRRLLQTEPVLDWTRALRDEQPTPLGTLSLAGRICLLGPGVTGARLHSDVTLSREEDQREGSVRRLINVVIQQARRLGDEFAFEANGELLWSRVRARLADLGRVLAAGGALHTDAGAQAFVVRCGRDTMTQGDIDAGRLIARIELVPATPVHRIVVVLALRDPLPGSVARVAA